MELIAEYEGRNDLPDQSGELVRVGNNILIGDRVVGRISYIVKLGFLGRTFAKCMLVVSQHEKQRTTYEAWRFLLGSVSRARHWQPPRVGCTCEIHANCSITAPIDEAPDEPC